jgi:hypothetical protein
VPSIFSLDSELASLADIRVVIPELAIIKQSVCRVWRLFCPRAQEVVTQSGRRIELIDPSFGRFVDNLTTIPVAAALQCSLA